MDKTEKLIAKHGEEYRKLITHASTWLQKKKRRARNYYAKRTNEERFIDGLIERRGELTGKDAAPTKKYQKVSNPAPQPALFWPRNRHGC